MIASTTESRRILVLPVQTVLISVVVGDVEGCVVVVEKVTESVLLVVMSVVVVSGHTIHVLPVALSV